MEEIFARISKAGRVVCGRQHGDGGFYCDEPVAALMTLHETPGYSERRLAALPGWRPDRKGVWRRTTSVEDRRNHGRPTSRGARVDLELPALVCCPKCRAVQWLDAERLKVAAATSNVRPSRWAIPSRQ